MQIIDAQIHLWGTGLPSNLAHRQVTAFTPEEAIALMDEGGGDAAGHLRIRIMQDPDLGILRQPRRPAVFQITQARRFPLDADALVKRERFADGIEIGGRMRCP